MKIAGRKKSLGAVSSERVVQENLQSRGQLEFHFVLLSFLLPCKPIIIVVFFTVETFIKTTEFPPAWSLDKPFAKLKSI
jgi:hypothetical protein